MPQNHVPLPFFILRQFSSLRYPLSEPCLACRYLNLAERVIRVTSAKFLGVKRDYFTPKVEHELLSRVVENDMAAVCQRIFHCQMASNPFEINEEIQVAVIRYFKFQIFRQQYVFEILRTLVPAVKDASHSEFLETLQDSDPIEIFDFLRSRHWVIYSTTMRRPFVCNSSGIFFEDCQNFFLTKKRWLGLVLSPTCCLVFERGRFSPRANVRWVRHSTVDRINRMSVELGDFSNGQFVLFPRAHG